ncbi:MAG: N-acetyltransferase family protein [Hyphomicrobiaceae bacterium]
MSGEMDIRVIEGFREGDRAELVALLREYETSIGISLCFQNFDAEVAGLPGAYAPPTGTMLLARAAADGGLVGFVAARGLAGRDGACEMKRLFVRDAARGTGLGRRLAVSIIERARALGFRTMHLDTLPSMTAAQALYRSLGFRQTDNYGASPHPGALYFALALDGTGHGPGR